MGRFAAVAVVLLLAGCTRPLKSDPDYRQLVEAQAEAAKREDELQRKLGELATTIVQLQDQLAAAQTVAADAAAKAAEAAADVAVLKGTKPVPPVKPDPGTKPKPVKPVAKTPPAQPGVVTGKVTFAGTGTPLARVVVYVVSVPGKRKRGKGPVVAEIKQSDLQFSPSHSVVVRGSSVAFPNNDKVFHNVFSLSDAARFDLGLYKSGSSKTVEFDKAGTVDVFCNIHPQMKAKIKVLDNAYYAYTNPDGTFKIEGVPAGTRSIGAWRADLKEAVGKVEVKPGESVVLDITAGAGGKVVDTHTRKDGSPYGRYK